MRRILYALFGEDTSWAHWQWYKKFFNITVLKYLVTWFAVIPLFAKLLTKLPPELVFEINCKTYTIPLELPFKWEYLWISSLLFVVAYTLYLAFCPKFIKTYSSFRDYLSHQHSPRWISWISRDLLKLSNAHNIEKFHNRLLVKNYVKIISQNEQQDLLLKDKTKVQDDPKNMLTPNAYIGEKQTTLVYNFEKNLFALFIPILDSTGLEDKNSTEIAEREIFWEVFGRFSSSLRGIRLIITALLIVSGIFFIIAISQNISSAFEYFSK